MRDYKKYTVWQDAMDFAVEVYNLTESFPSKEVYALASQLQRAAASIPSNIAEGAGRNTAIDFAHFIDNAVGSAFESETQLLLAKRLGYITEEQWEKSNDMILSIQRRLHELIKTLRS